MHKAITYILIALVIILFVLFISNASAESFIKSLDFGGEDADLLMRIAQAELGNASAEEKAEFMFVILNRVWHPDYPNDIESVILDSGLRSVENDSWLSAKPDENCEKAIELVYSGQNKIGNSLILPREKKPMTDIEFVHRFVRILEVALPMLLILFFILLFALLSVRLSMVQDDLINNARNAIQYYRRRK